MISLQNLKELLAQAPADAKKAPHIATLEQAFAKTLASVFKKDDETDAAPQHIKDSPQEIIATVATQLAMGHATLQAASIMNAVSLRAAPSAVLQAALPASPPGTIKLDDNWTASDALPAATTEPLAPRAPQSSEAASASHHALQVNATELVDLVARHVSPDQPRVELILQPPELGRVRLDVDIRNNDVHIKVTAETHDVAKTLRDSLPQLEAALREQGLRVGSIDVAMQSSGSELGLDAGSGGNNRGAYEGAEPSEAIEVIDQKTPKQQSPRKKRGLDVLV